VKTLAEIKQQIETAKPQIQQKYHVVQLGLFGSYVRGEQTSASDIDVLVEFEPGFRFGLVTLCELENDLSDLLGMRVDLVMKKGLRTHIGEQVLREVIYL
jgi:uncharacterized protein